MTLRPATLADRRAIFEWLAHSDITHWMLGPPAFPDNPVPTWEEFVDDYIDSYFESTDYQVGHAFIMEVNGEPVGQIAYNDITEDGITTELDIWLAASKYTGKGYGTDALLMLVDYLHQEYGCQQFIIAPSRRNVNAVKSYQKAGFVETSNIPAHFIPDYEDTVILIKTLPPA